MQTTWANLCLARFIAQTLEVKRGASHNFVNRREAAGKPCKIGLCAGM
jgi:hypothetical protein